MDEIWAIMTHLRDMNATANKQGRHLSWETVSYGDRPHLRIDVELSDEDAETIKRMQQFFGVAE